MRTQTLNRHNDYKKFAKGSHVKGHLNGLLIVINNMSFGGYGEIRDMIDSTKLKIKYVEDRVRTLVPSIPLHNFMDITNLKYGSTNESGMISNTMDNSLLHLFQQIPALADDETLDIVKTTWEQNTVQNNSGQIQFFVDLGSIYVDGGNELHYELSSRVEARGVNVEVYALSKENEPSHFYEYDTDADRNEMHQNVIASYMCSPVQVERFADIELTIDATSVQYESNTKGLLATSSLFNKIENNSIGRTLPVFEALDSAPEDVQIKFISNDDLSGYYVLNQRIDTSFSGYIDGKRKAIAEKAKVIEQLEDKQPELAEVLQAEGMPSSTQLKERIL